MEQVSSHLRCPACSGRSCLARGRLAGWRNLECPDCGHSFLEPSQRLFEQLPGQYGDGYGGHEPDGRFRDTVQSFLELELAPAVPPPARILDVGSGNGEFLEALSAFGYDGVGLELSRPAVQRCRERGLDARSDDFLEPLTFAGEIFDAVTMWDVIEHLPEPSSFLSRARKVLAPGGILVVKTPSVTADAVRLGRLSPRLARSLLHTPRHIQFFCRSSLSRMLADEGFREQRWLEARPMRGGRPSRTLRKAVARFVRRRLHRWSGSGNLLVVARSQS